MTLTSEPRLSGTLSMAAGLTAIAGFADAHAFLFITKVFIANMSGNLVLLGIALGDEQWILGARLFASVVFFIAGIGVVTFIHDRHRRAGRPLRPDLVLVVEAGLLVAMVAWVAVVGADRPGSAAVVVYPALALGAFGMGMQNAALLRVGMVAVATTYASGSSARLAAEAALALNAPTPEEGSAHRRGARVMAVLVVAYVAGAALAAALGAALGWMLLAPVGLVVLAVARRRWVLGDRSAEESSGE